MEKFIILIKGEDKWAELSPAEMEEGIVKYSAWAEKLRSEDRLIDCDALHETVHLISGSREEPVFSEGPSGEIQEVVGGYYLFHAKDVEEARAIATTCPTLDYGGVVELRQIAKFS